MIASRFRITIPDCVVVTQVLWAIWPHDIVIEHFGGFETLKNRRVKRGIIRNVPQHPWGEAEEAASSLIMLGADRVGIQLQNGYIAFQPGLNRLVEHPPKRNIRQPGFVFRIAATNVGMIPGKPSLHKPVGWFRLFFRIVAAPWHPR